jgi:hypothetical protein
MIWIKKYVKALSFYCWNLEMQTDDDSSKFVKNLECLKISFHFSIEFAMKNVDL